jgi:hypothetical protein
MAIKPEDVFSCLNIDLQEAGCTESADFYPDIQVRDAFAVSLRQSLFKKLKSRRTSLADEKALTKFLHVNENCKNWNLRIQDTKTEVLLGHLRQCLFDFWYRGNGVAPLVDHPYDLITKGKVGPGANIGARGGSAYAKLFASPLHCSDQSLYFWYSRYIRNFPEWSNAEIIRRDHFGEASVGSNSRLSFVPKNDEISRCICIEPSLNTFFQLGFAQILEDRLLERFGISLSKQPFLNRDLARLGSITEGLSTIDLSSASDSISMKMLEAILPHDFLRWLKMLRCRSVEIKGRDTEELHMVSTMGNGFTFPLQTMLFSCIVVACMEFRNLRPYRSLLNDQASIVSDSSDDLWGVFGDDIICPSKVTRDGIHLLDTLGFTVNNEKTFTEGPFRESCGADFFRGVDIRGVYLKSLDTPQALYAAVNLLARFSVRSEIPLRRTIRFLLSNINKVTYVPPYEDLSSGLHVPVSMVRDRGRSNGTQSISYELWIPKTSRYRITNSHILSPSDAKSLIYNPSGLLLSLLLGEVNACTFGFRDKIIRYKRKRRYSSFWMSTGVSDRDHFDYGLDWQRWESAVEDLSES